MSESLAIELKGITKTFGSIVANKDVNLQVKKRNPCNTRRKRQRQNHPYEYAFRYLFPG